MRTDQNLIFCSMTTTKEDDVFEVLSPLCAIKFYTGLLKAKYTPIKLAVSSESLLSREKL
jgi:hypothetical protein